MAHSNPPQQNSRTSTNTTLVGTGTTLSPPDNPLRVAIKRFTKDNPKKDLAQFKNTTYDELRNAVMQIQKEQEERREMMDLARIQSFLEAMHQFGKVVEVFLNVADALAFVWGPMKLLLQTASTFTDSFEALLRAYEQIGEQMPLLLEYDSLFRSNAHVKEALIRTYIDILEFHQQALKFFRGSMWKNFFRAMWKDFETKFGGVLERLGRHREYVESCASVAHFQQSRKELHELRLENESLHQQLHNDITDLQATSLTQHQITQNGIAQAQTTSLAQSRKYEADIALLKSTTQATEAGSQKHSADLARMEANDAARHRAYVDDMAKLHSKVDEMLEQDRRKKKGMVKEWLAVGQQIYDDHESYRRVRQDHPNTTQWILQHENVKDWMLSDTPVTPILWINGIPGAGKTILASAIIDSCKQTASNSTCFFYCRSDDPTSSSPVGILKGLVEQLLNDHPHFLPVCHTRRTMSGEPILRSLNLTTKMLQELCVTLEKTFIVIDGLDECSQVERKQTLDALMEIVAQCEHMNAGKLRLLVVSQDFLDIRRSFSGDNKMALKVVQISHEDNENDIFMYVKFWVDKIASKFELVKEVTDYLTNLTVANAKGMFLFAKLVMHNLYEQPTREMLLDAIRTSNFPTKLKEAYERILDRIKAMSSTEEWTEATKLLGWMVCAKRRLTWKEMQVALSIDLDNQAIEYENKRLRKHIHEICGSLISVNSDRVSFVHSTAKTFITHVIPDIHEPSIECDLSVLCLQYLTFPCFEKFEEGDKGELQKLALEGYLALQDYAVATWFHHINAFVNGGQEFLDKVSEQSDRLDSIAVALDEFMSKYAEEDWEKGLVEECRTSCHAFEHLPFHENLVLLTSHIYTFQKKGFEARHKISIKTLDEALKQNRIILESLPAELEKSRATSDLTAYRKFYDAEKLYKCNRITCRYFSEGFKDKQSRKRHVNVHDRPYHCDVQDCLGQEGFAKENDLQKHMRAFHPELCDLAQTFNTATAKRGKADHACSICGKTFTRSFHRKNHELSHRGERPYSCPECGKAFTRANDCKRHQKIHERKSK